MNDKLSQELKIIDRNIFSLTGVNKIISFDKNEFIVDSNLGIIHINGDNLELQSIDVSSGVLKILGRIDGYKYIEKVGNNKQESIITKLFK